MKKILFLFPAILLALAVPASSLQTFFVKRTNITTTSVLISFGFPAKIVQVQADAANTAEICVDWLGATAVCPGANAAGDDRIPAGATVTLDNFRVGNVSVIAASGTQTIYIRAWE